jgi:hypothetical protein
LECHLALSTRLALAQGVVKVVILLPDIGPPMHRLPEVLTRASARGISRMPVGRATE